MQSPIIKCKGLLAELERETVIDQLLQEGYKSKISDEISASTLMNLEDKPSSYLKHLINHIKNKFNITISVPSVQKLLLSLNITSELDNLVPCKSNKALFLLHQHNLVLNRLTNVLSLLDAKTLAILLLPEVIESIINILFNKSSKNP